MSNSGPSKRSITSEAAASLRTRRRTGDSSGGDSDTSPPEAAPLQAPIAVDEDNSSVCSDSSDNYLLISGINDVSVADGGSNVNVSDIQQALPVLGSSSQAARERRDISRNTKSTASTKRTTVISVTLSTSSSASSGMSTSPTAGTSHVPSDITMTDVCPQTQIVEESEGYTVYEANTLWEESFKQFYMFYQQSTLCDVAINVGEKSIHCHKVILASVSQYFKTMFTSEMAESFQSSVTINDIDETALQELIDFAYTSKIKLNVENVQSLLYASSILQVESVALACGEFMKSHLHPSNCIGIRSFAEQHGRVELMNKTDQYIRDNFLDVVSSEEFSTMPHKYLEYLVGSPDINVDSEHEVYEAVMTWINFDTSERQKHLPSLIEHVKLPLLDATYLMDHVARNELIKNDLKCRDFLDEAKDFQLSLAHVVPDRKLSNRTCPRKSCAGVIFCVGGRGASGDPFKSIECYDLRKNQWFHVAEMSCRRRHVGVVSVNGLLYAVGGHDGSDHLSSAEVFDPAKNKWKAIASMSTLRRGIALAHLGGPIYAVGGLDDSTCFNTVERYDIASDKWTCVQKMHRPRGGVAVAALKGYLYAIGGNDGAASLDTCERYDPHLNKWTLVAPMTKRRAGAGVSVLNGCLYVIGGFDDNAPLDCVERYDPANDKWESIANMSCFRGGVGVASLGGRIYAVGGHDGSHYLKSVEMYDAIENRWELVSKIDTRRAGAGVAVVQCQINQLKDVTKCTLAASEDDSILAREDALAGRL